MDESWRELSLQELAEAAQEKIDEPIDFEDLVRETVKAYGNLVRFGDRLYAVDYDSIFKRHAEKLGKDKLTTLEKRQAVLDAVLEQANG